MPTKRAPEKLGSAG